MKLLKTLLTCFVATFVALCCVLLLPTEAEAAVSGGCGSDVTWSLSKGTLTISGAGHIRNFDLKNEAPWKEYRSSISTVVIKEGIISIGNYAFYNCTSLTKVTFANSVTTIGDFAFAHCTNITNVSIPNSVITVGENAFYDCTKLTSVTIPDSVTTLSAYAFCNCTSLTSVTLGKGVDAIDLGTFDNCTSLTSVSIPNNVTIIGPYAFSECVALTGITIPNSVTEIGSCAFLHCISLTGITIPDYVTAIGESAFSNCTSLKIVTIGDRVETIENEAFSWCTSLASATLPDSVTTLGEDVFQNCENLTYVKLSNRITTIRNTVFVNCYELVNINIPDSVISIGDGAFMYCRKLTSVTLGNGVATVGLQAFSGCSSLASITLPNSVTAIGDYAFYNCKSLTSINIPDGVKTIGEYAFSNCVLLTDITIPVGITTINRFTFSLCKNLTSVSIPYTVTTIDEYAFKDCNKLSVYGLRGSYAEQYALENQIPFIGDGGYQVSNGQKLFATLQEALNAYDSGVIQLLADADNVTVTKNAVVDLNGFDIASVTSANATLTVLDNKTDDYSVADGIYGKIVAISGTVNAADDYVAIAEADGTSYHKISLKITNMSLRSSNAGVYYKGSFSGDEVVAEHVTRYGVALSLRGTPAVGAPRTAYSAYKKFSSGTNTPGTLLKNVIKDTYSSEQNNENAKLPIYGRAYIQIGENYFYSETVSRSFRQQVELVDTIWDNLTVKQQAAVVSLYNAFRDCMKYWSITFIKENAYNPY